MLTLINKGYTGIVPMNLWPRNLSSARGMLWALPSGF